MFYDTARRQVAITLAVTGQAALTHTRMLDWCQANPDADFDHPETRALVEALLGIDKTKPGPMIDWDSQQCGAWAYDAASEDYPDAEYAGRVTITWAFA